MSSDETDASDISENLDMVNDEIIIPEKNDMLEANQDVGSGNIAEESRIHEDLEITNVAEGASGNNEDDNVREVISDLDEDFLENENDGSSQAAANTGAGLEAV